MNAGRASTQHRPRQHQRLAIPALVCVQNQPDVYWTSVDLSQGGTYVRGMQVFTMTVGGLMYQATIGGQKYGFTPIE